MSDSTKADPSNGFCRVRFIYAGLVREYFMTTNECSVLVNDWHEDETNFGTYMVREGSANGTIVKLDFRFGNIFAIETANVDDLQLPSAQYDGNRRS